MTPAKQIPVVTMMKEVEALELIPVVAIDDKLNQIQINLRLQQIPYHHKQESVKINSRKLFTMHT